MSYRERRPEYSPILKIGSGIIIADLALSGCVGRIQQTGSQETRSPQPGVTEVVPTPSPTEERITYVNGTLPDNNEISRYFGPLDGNPREITIREGDFLHRTLLNYNLAPAGEARSSVVAKVAQLPSGERVCVPTMPDRLYNPNIPSTEDTRFSEQDLRQANINSSEFTYKYGDPPGQVRFDAAGAVTLKNTESDLFCVNAVINDPDNPIRDPNGTPAAFGKLLTVLMDTSGEVYGTLPAVYATGQNVRITDEGYVYSGDEQVWFTGSRMAELASQLTPTSEATATPNYEELQRLKPQGVEGEVVMGENRRPQLKLELENFNSQNGMTIAEYMGGRWNPTPFELSVSTEQSLNDLGLDDRWFPQGGGINEITGLGSVGYKALIQAIKLDHNEGLNEYQIELAFVHRGGIYRLSPDAILVHPVGNLSRHEVYEDQDVSAEQVGKLLTSMDRENGRQNVFVSLYFATDNVNTETCGYRTSDIYIGSFAEFCRKQANNESGQLRTLDEVKQYFSGYEQTTGLGMAESGFDWFGKESLQTLSTNELYVFMEVSVDEDIYDWP